MKAVELDGLNGPNSLQVVEAEIPMTAPGEVLVEVKAAGINYAELEQTHGKYPLARPLPCRMGFEAAGIVAKLGPGVTGVKVGDRVAGLMSSGGFADYATAEPGVLLPIPPDVSFAKATTLPIQGVTAYALLRFVAKPRPTETVLIQAAAGGVGLFLLQMAKALGAGRVIALASSPEKLNLVRTLGADVAINYVEPGWADRVRNATDGNGANVVLEMSSGDVGAESFRLMAPFGRIVVFGARNLRDTITPARMQQLISKNQTIHFFNIPTYPVELVRESVSGLLGLVRDGRVRLFADNIYPLTEVRAAFEALSSRRTIGKVVLVP